MRLSAVARTLRLARVLRQGGASAGRGAGGGGRWELPLLAAIATFILTIGSAPFVGPATGWQFARSSRADWVAPASLSTEDVRSVPQVGVARTRGDGDYSYTPEMQLVTMHLVRPEVWERYRSEFLGANLERPVSADDLVLDESTARSLGVGVGDRVAVMALFADGVTPPVEVRVGAVVPPYVEAGGTASGLVAVTGRRLGAPAVQALAPHGRPWRFGIGAVPPGGQARTAVMGEFLDRLTSAGAGWSSSSTLVIGGFLWWLALARYGRRVRVRDRRATALLVVLGCPSRSASVAAALPVLATAALALLAGTVIAGRGVFLVIQQRTVPALAFAPLLVVLGLGSALVTLRTYRGLLARTGSTQLARSLAEEI